MGNPLEVTGEDIAKLDDSALRKLIRLLCEADFRRARISVSGITGGGHQDAKDGGLDVRVVSQQLIPQESFIPRKKTGFQSKASKMPPSSIQKEMMPKGKLRDAIVQLARDSGAYVICASKESVTGTALAARKKAMEDAVAHLNKSRKKIKVDFFDQDRIAQWTSMHPSLAATVREMCGRPLRGWRGYDSWAYSRGEVTDEYIADDNIRAYDRTGSNDGCTILEAIASIRERLSIPSSTVRLVGLSGTGKTRLAQALFDDRLSSNALNQNLALYTDFASGPQPDPQALLEFLVADRRSAVMIVDNCPRELHARLTTACSLAKTHISVLTIEYDVQEDIPEETAVFKLEPASDNVVERLLATRFPLLSGVDRQHIARVSGGNARVAIAISGTVKPSQSISHLRSEELFGRLFWQGDDKDRTLLRCAEAFSIVYSFDGQPNGDGSEIDILAKCCSLKKSDLIRAIALLQRRNLIQSRDRWRAILPHAIANYLAGKAIASIARDELLDCILSSSERMIRSFSRRLSYLYEVREAIEIGQKLLANDGWLGKSLSRLNQLGMTVLGNIAPVVPSETLAVIEKTASEHSDVFLEEYDAHSQRILAKLLWQMAYESDHFERAVVILAKLAARERNANGTARRFLKSLFRPHWSGTHASPRLRAQVLEKIFVEDVARGKLAMDLLQSAFQDQGSQFTQDFEFGGRSRDYGAVFQSQSEISAWFSAFFDVGIRIANSNRSAAESVRSVLAIGFYNAWVAGSHEEAARLARALHANKPWSEGWAKLREILMRRKWLSPASVALAEKLEIEIAPRDAASRLRSFLCCDGYRAFSLVCEKEIEKPEEYGRASERLQEAARELGRQLANRDELAEVQTELFQNNNLLFSIGIGIAHGASDKQATLDVLLAGWRIQSAELERRIALFDEFLSHENSTVVDWAEKLREQVRQQIVKQQLAEQQERRRHVSGFDDW